MDDDIVIRLRKWARRIESWQFESDTTSELREAADEIERLRAEVARLNSFLHPIGVVMNVKEGKNFDAKKIAELIAKRVRNGF